jgi:hypothetical protein
MNNIATATIVDPRGVSIELTEGLDRSTDFTFECTPSAANCKIGLVSLQFDELTAMPKPLHQTMTGVRQLPVCP